MGLTQAQTKRNKRGAVPDISSMVIRQRIWTGARAGLKIKTLLSQITKNVTDAFPRQDRLRTNWLQLNCAHLGFTPADTGIQRLAPLVNVLSSQARVVHSREADERKILGQTSRYQAVDTFQDRDGAIGLGSASQRRT